MAAATAPEKVNLQESLGGTLLSVTDAAAHSLGKLRRTPTRSLVGCPQRVEAFHDENTPVSERLHFCFRCSSYSKPRAAGKRPDRNLKMWVVALVQHGLRICRSSVEGPSCPARRQSK